MAQTDLNFYLKENQAESYLPFGSARGCLQTLYLEYPPLYTRSLNGELVVLKQGLDKYTSVLSCEDVVCPSFEVLKPGLALWIECIHRLTTKYLQKEEVISLNRAFVKNSLLRIDSFGKSFVVDDDACKEGKIQMQEEGYLSYRPLLYMMLTDIKSEVEEWQGRFKWKMTLQEI